MRLLVNQKIKTDLEGFEPPISGSEVLCHSRLDHRPKIKLFIFLF